MSTLVIVLLAAFAVGLAGLAYAAFAPKRVPQEEAVPVAPAPATPAGAVGASSWTDSALREFDALGDAARCDFVFAVGALPDERTRRILLHALDDRSEAVALAAAHVLARAGALDDVRRAVAHQDPARREALMQLLSVIT